MSNFNEKNDKNDQDNGEKNQGNMPGKTNRFALIVLVLVVVVSGIFLLQNPGGAGNEQISYTRFYEYLDTNSIESVMIGDYQIIQGVLKGSETAMVGADGKKTIRFVTTIPYVDDRLLERLLEKGVKVSGGTNVNPMKVALDVIPWILMLVFFFWIFRQVQAQNGNKAFQFGKSKAKRYNEGGKRVLFADVAGQKEAKYELQEVVEFLKNPGKFTKMGAKIPKGVLLVGMPGTGKTLLAKACAGEAGVPFFHMSGSDFVEMFVGVGASRVRDLFEQGRKSAPCILFIDELDAVGRTRGAGYGGGHDEREQTLNQMLVEMDGFDTKDGVIILAATNRPDVLDPALLRPGRFDRQVVVDMPDMVERAAILGIHAAKIPLGEGVDLNRLGRATPGASGADLSNLVNEAALYAARKGKEKVDMDDFEEARDKIFMGIARRSRSIDDKEKLATAYHEIGHALLHYYLKDADPLHKVTVVPRGRALGVAWSLPDKDRYTRGRGYYQDRIVISYGGYIAEELIYGETSSGAVSDIKSATEIARRMVCEWGMSSLGPIAFGAEDEPIFLGKEIARHKDYSEQTAQQIDGEVTKILTTALNTARDILSTHRDQLEKLAHELVLKETLTDAEVRECLGMPPAPREAPDAVIHGPELDPESIVEEKKDEGKAE